MVWSDRITIYTEKVELDLLLNFNLKKASCHTVKNHSIAKSPADQVSELRQSGYSDITNSTENGGGSNWAISQFTWMNFLQVVMTLFDLIQLHYSSTTVSCCYTNQNSVSYNERHIKVSQFVNSCHQQMVGVGNLELQ